MDFVDCSIGAHEGALNFTARTKITVAPTTGGMRRRSHFEPKNTEIRNMETTQRKKQQNARFGAESPAEKRDIMAVKDSSY
ncbi:hypothetical protein Y032_0373g172 [Ancylostoma ceylanicum]|nr:hypothetical protein Y032_0373g172 [Ancylostoma ceylanicum]